MSKTKDNQIEHQQALDELLTNGHTVLTAATREQLADIAGEVISAAEGKTVTAGAVGQDFATATYSLRLDIINS